MSKKQVKTTRQIGKNPAPEKKPIIDPKYKSFFNTMVFLLIMLIFFIVNNTRKEPEHGPYPPFYKQKSSQPAN